MEMMQAATRDTPQEGRKPPFKLPKLPKKGKKRARLAALILLACLGVFWFARRPSGDAGAGMAGLYAPVTVERRDLTVSVPGTGAVTPINSYQLKALATGEVLEAPFEVGDRVEKGALLYRLDAKDAERGIEQAELALRQAQKNYDDLVGSLTVSASAAGVVQRVLVQKGDAVTPGTPVAEIADASTLTVTLPFHAADAQRIAPGQSAQVTVAGTLETLPGVVESVSSADIVGTGGALVRQVKIRVDNPGALTSGHSATALVGDIACAGSAHFEENLRQTVTAQASGEVTGVDVTAGSRVSAGDALLRIGGAAARSSLEDLEIALENARLSLQRAQDALENYTITAPISGTVIEKNVKAGDKVDGMESGALAVIFDLSSLELEMDVSELDIGKLQTGQRVTLTAKALPGETFTGHVEHVSINGATSNGFTNYPITVLVEEYGDLKPGTNVSAVVQCATVEDALCVPVAAVQRGDTVLVPAEGAMGEDGVTVVDPSRLEERPVTLGVSDGTYIQITSGLEEGETVLISAQAEGLGG